MRPQLHFELRDSFFERRPATLLAWARDESPLICVRQVSSISICHHHPVSGPHQEHILQLSRWLTPGASCEQHAAEGGRETDSERETACCAHRARTRSVQPSRQCRQGHIECKPPPLLASQAPNHHLTACSVVQKLSHCDCHNQTSKNGAMPLSTITNTKLINEVVCSLFRGWATAGKMIYGLCIYLHCCWMSQ